MVTTVGANRNDLPDMRPLIRQLARRLKAGLWSSVEDSEDFEQELWITLVEAWSGFDPDRGPAIPYATAVLCRAAAMLFRGRRAKKRRSQLHSFTNLEMTEDDDLKKIVDDHAFDARDRELDLESALRSLPSDKQELANLLSVQSIAQVARELGLPRSTLQRQIALIKNQLLKLSINDYLK